MATNTLGNYVPEFWANQALIQLEKALGMASRIYRRYEDERSGRGNNVGDVINIRKPSAFTAQSAPSSAQNLDTGTAKIDLTSWQEVKFEVTDKELAWTGDRVIEDHIRPAAYALAEKIDSDLCNLYLDIPWMYPCSAAASISVSDVTGPRKILFDNGVPLNDPSMIHYMVDGATEEGLLKLSNFTQWQGSGQTGVDSQLRGSLGTRFGMEIFANQNVKTFTNGTASDFVMAVNQSSSPTGYAAGVSTINLDAAGTGTLVPGDSLVFAGHSQRYVITNTTTAAANAHTGVTIAPALVSAVADNEVVSIWNAAGGAATGVQNMAFHQNAFALAFAPLPTIPNELGANVFVASDPVTGLSLRARIFYVGDSSKLVVALDTLYGYTTLDRNLAVRSERVA